jgi:hypothetical protein
MAHPNGRTRSNAYPACDMNGASGTTIKTASKVLYEVLPKGRLRSFSLIDMGEVPEQATQFKCYLRAVSIEW